MPSTVGSITARDGTTLLVRDWPAVEPWAEVVLVHGLGEHSGRYEHVGEYLAAAGISVHAYDQRGFGGSGGDRADIDRWSRYHDDLEDRLDAIRDRGAGRRVVTYGHSMGALVVLGYLLGDRPMPDLAVLSAPGVDSSVAAWRKALARVLGRIAPRVSMGNGIDPRDLSRDPAVVAAYRVDPANWHRATVRFGALGLAEQDRVKAALGDLRVPSLVINGADDALVPPAVSEPLARVASVTRVVHPGLVHEIHNEPEWRVVLDGVVDWLKGNVRSAAVV